MTPTTLRAVAMAALVLLAGCAGGVTEPADDTTTTPDAGDSPTADATGNTGTVPGDRGTVRFYVSDEPNAIGDFRRLAVTVSRVGLERAGGGGENESDAGWVEYAVDNRTADLTELRGDNATLLDEFDVPAGDYSKVFVHVSDVNATLSTGERVRVKLPSGKLQIEKGFAVGPNATVEFVFDIAVHRAGKSGKYVLRPVIGQSGADVPVQRIDDDAGEERDEDGEDDSGKAEESDEAEDDENGEGEAEFEEADGEDGGG